MKFSAASVRIDEIPVRGLKLKIEAGSMFWRSGVRIDEIPVRGLKLTCHSTPIRPEPKVRIDEIPVRGLKLRCPPQKNDFGAFGQNRRNPRQGIETHFPHPGPSPHDQVSE